MNLKLALSLCMAILCGYGCASKKSLVVLIPDTDGKVGRIAVGNSAGEQVLHEAYAAVEVKENRAPEMPRIMNPKEVEKIFSEVLESSPPDPSRFILYFTTGTTSLTDESKAHLHEVLAEVRKRLPCDVYIAGHTDTVGKKDLNIKLSFERAEIVKNELVRIGVDSILIKVAAHGESDLLISTSDEVEEPRNRRVEVFIR
ncbi:MAG: OmpA family protein [Thermodesulfobacteriota bacterium]